MQEHFPFNSVSLTAASAFRPLLPWAVAAGFAICAGWFGLLHLTSQSETEWLRTKVELAELGLRSARQQLEAERIISRRELAGLGEQVAAANAQSTGAHRPAAERAIPLSRQDNDSKTPGDLSNLQSAALVSQSNHAPKALAVAIWDAVKQEGLLLVENLPVLPADQDYQLWIQDSLNPAPVDGGVLMINSGSGNAHLRFTARQPVRAVDAFTITLERKGGAPKAQGAAIMRGKAGTLTPGMPR